MTIEILETRTIEGLSTRVAVIAISSGGSTYLWTVGGLPAEGNLQTVLNGREAELWREASARGEPFDVFEVAERRLLKAMALVILDEINVLREAVIPPLSARNEGQIRQAIVNKLKSL